MARFSGLEYMAVRGVSFKARPSFSACDLPVSLRSVSLPLPWMILCWFQTVSPCLISISLI